MPASLVALRCRISDRRVESGEGVEALSRRLPDVLGVEPRAIGAPAPPRFRPWDEDLREARGCLLEAGGQVDDALAAGRVPVLIAGDCAVGLTTLGVVARRRPDARVLWLDAHGDFNTPATSDSGWLGGMALSGATGRWQPGLGPVLPPNRAVLAGVRALDPAERIALQQSPVTVIGASLETLVFTQNALDRAPVYVHLDPDVLDPSVLASVLPEPDGLRGDRLYDLLEAVCGECELVGVEVAHFAVAGEAAARGEAADALVAAAEPLFAAAARGPSRTI